MIKYFQGGFCLVLFLAFTTTTWAADELTHSDNFEANSTDPSHNQRLSFKTALRFRLDAAKNGPQRMSERAPGQENPQELTEEQQIKEKVMTLLDPNIDLDEELKELSDNFNEKDQVRKEIQRILDEAILEQGKGDENLSEKEAEEKNVFVAYLRDLSDRLRDIVIKPIGTDTANNGSTPPQQWQGELPASKKNNPDQSENFAQTPQEDNFSGEYNINDLREESNPLGFLSARNTKSDTPKAPGAKVISAIPKPKTKNSADSNTNTDDEPDLITTLKTVYIYELVPSATNNEVAPSVEIIKKDFFKSPPEVKETKSAKVSKPKSPPRPVVGEPSIMEQSKNTADSTGTFIKGSNNKEKGVLKVDYFDQWERAEITIAASTANVGNSKTRFQMPPNPGKPNVASLSPAITMQIVMPDQAIRLDGEPLELSGPQEKASFGGPLPESPETGGRQVASANIGLGAFERLTKPNPSTKQLSPNTPIDDTSTTLSEETDKPYNGPSNSSHMPDSTSGSTQSWTNAPTKETDTDLGLFLNTLPNLAKK